MGDEHHTKCLALVVDESNGERGAIEGDETLLDDVREERRAGLGRWGNLERESERVSVLFSVTDGHDVVNVTLDKVAPEAGMSSHGSFKIDACANFELAKICARERFWCESDFKCVRVKMGNSETTSDALA